MSEAVQQLKGEIGTSVKLDVQHKGEERLVRLEVTRAQIQIHSVKGARLLDEELGVGYLRITAFNSATLDEVRAAVKELGSLGLKALVLDLRGNPG
ncbi:MAG TPA: S41 family peptidase, partial [Planctomycetes bacterium]|nr:S41 family peptidase [Planctomycetota bacterium]